jgi:hypothetical protein
VGAEILLLFVVSPPLLAGLYVQWAMFVRRARDGR